MRPICGYIIGRNLLSRQKKRRIKTQSRKIFYKTNKLLSPLTLKTQTRAHRLFVAHRNVQYAVTEPILHKPKLIQPKKKILS